MKRRTVVSVSAGIGILLTLSACSSTSTTAAASGGSSVASAAGSVAAAATSAAATSSSAAGTAGSAASGTGGASSGTASSGTASSPAGGSGGGSAAGCDTVTAKYPSVKGQQIIVGSSPGGSNYDYPDPADPNKIIGIEPDLLDAVSKCAGFTFTFLKQDFNGLIPSLQAKHINLIASGMYASDERAKQISFVQYMKAGEASVVAKGNPKNLTSMDSTCGVIAAEAVGTVENAIFDKQNAACKAAGKPTITPLSFQGNDQAINAVAQGRADIFLTDSGVASYLADKLPKIQVGFPIVSDFVFGFGVGKADTALLNAVQDSMTQLYTTGQLEKIVTKWGFSPSQVYKPAIKA